MHDIVIGLGQLDQTSTLELVRRASLDQRRKKFAVRSLEVAHPLPLGIQLAAQLAHLGAQRPLALANLRDELTQVVDVTPRHHQLIAVVALIGERGWLWQTPLPSAVGPCPGRVTRWPV